MRTQTENCSFDNDTGRCFTDKDVVELLTHDVFNVHQPSNIGAGKPACRCCNNNAVLLIWISVQNIPSGELRFRSFSRHVSVLYHHDQRESRSAASSGSSKENQYGS